MRQNFDNFYQKNAQQNNDRGVEMRSKCGALWKKNISLQKIRVFQKNNETKL